MFCFTFSNSTNDNEVDSIGVNDSSMDILDMLALPLQPHIVYNELNATHYQWCGISISLAEYLAQFTRTR